MRFNFISKDADGIGFAFALQKAGESVRVFIDEKDAQSVGDGLVPKVGSVHEMLADADRDKEIFVFDTSGDGLLGDYLRSMGYAVIGSSALADRLERERDFGLQVMVECGIKVPESIPFTSFEDARRYVEKNSNKRLVYKPNNILGDKSLSHVSYNAEDMIELLTNVENEVSIENPEFVLQEFEEGICISTEVWFDGYRNLPLMNHTFERKELMDGNLGKSGGCTGNVVWTCGECPICEKVKGILPWLEENGYHGMLDLNAIVSFESGDILGLEWTPRFGYDASPTILLGLLDGDLGRFLSDVAKRQYGSSSPKFFDDRIASGIRVSVPPWPSEQFCAEQNLPIFGLPDEHYLFNVKAGNVTQLATSGAWGILACVIGTGSTVKKAFKKPYEVVKELYVSNKQYRTDLVGQFEEDFEKLASIIPEAINGVSSSI